ncbi:MAG TPA: flagellar basal body-associated FliL family protein [Azospira sp.]|nr:flagellar basal body-associated FliL family protein [Azospira sp.]
MKIIARCRLMLLCLACLVTFPAVANDHGGSAPAESLRFVVNLAGGGRVLQVDMIFEGAHPEVEATLKTIRPKVQHKLIILLASETADKLLTLEGKHTLAETIRDTLNKLLDETPKSGVKEVLFTNFIIQ